MKDLQHILPRTYLSGAILCCQMPAWWELQLLLLVLPDNQVPASLLTAHTGHALEH